MERKLSRISSKNKGLQIVAATSYKVNAFDQQMNHLEATNNLTREILDKIDNTEDCGARVSQTPKSLNQSRKFNQDWNQAAKIGFKQSSTEDFNKSSTEDFNKSSTEDFNKSSTKDFNKSSTKDFNKCKLDTSISQASSTKDPTNRTQELLSMNQFEDHFEFQPAEEALIIPTGDSSLATSSATAVVSVTNLEDLTCAICLELLRRPRRLRCGHSFCLLCLQHYVNTVNRVTFKCPYCRHNIAIPSAGPEALPVSASLEAAVKALNDAPVGCHTCSKITGVAGCGHCQRGFCDGCGRNHVASMKEQMKRFQLKSKKAAPSGDKQQLSLLQRHLVKLDDKILQLQEKRTHLHNALKQLSLQVEDQEGNTQSSVEKLLQQLSEGEDLEWRKVSQIYMDLKTLQTNSSQFQVFNFKENSQHSDQDSDVMTPLDQSLFYRKKPSRPRLIWSHHGGERYAGVAVPPWHSNEVYVTSSDTCRVMKSDLTGRQLEWFGTRGHEEGRFLCPFGVAFSVATREIFVTDKWKHCILVFDSAGNFTRQLGSKGKGFGQFISPEGIAIDKRGMIYVADTCNHRVQVLDSDGVFLRQLGLVSSETLRDGRRYTSSEFNEPTAVAVAADGSRVYVADTGNHRVKVFNSSGLRELTIGCRGVNTGQFESPEAVAVDHEGFVLVGDSGNGRIQIFKPNGTFVRYLGSNHKGVGELGWISSVALTRTLDIIVTDFKNCQVSIF